MKALFYPERVLHRADRPSVECLASWLEGVDADKRAAEYTSSRLVCYWHLHLPLVINKGAAHHVSNPLIARA